MVERRITQLTLVYFDSPASRGKPCHRPRQGQENGHTVAVHMLVEPEKPQSDNEGTDEHQIGDVRENVETDLLIQLEKLDIDAA